MEPITITILSGLIYDSLKALAKYGYDYLSKNLKKLFIENDIFVNNFVEEINKLDIDVNMSKEEIENKLKSNEKICTLLNEINDHIRNKYINQTSLIGNNVYNSGCGNISMGNISLNQEVN